MVSEIKTTKALSFSGNYSPANGIQLSYSVSGFRHICSYTVYRSSIIEMYDECVKMIIIIQNYYRLNANSCKMEHVQFAFSSSYFFSFFSFLISSTIPFFHKLRSHSTSALRILCSRIFIHLI